MPGRVQHRQVQHCVKNTVRRLSVGWLLLLVPSSMGGGGIKRIGCLVLVEACRASKEHEHDVWWSPTTPPRGAPGAGGPGAGPTVHFIPHTSGTPPFPGFRAPSPPP